MLLGALLLLRPYGVIRATMLCTRFAMKLKRQWPVAPLGALVERGSRDPRSFRLVGLLVRVAGLCWIALAVLWIVLTALSP